MDEKEIRAALGIDESADIAVAIAGMKSTITAQAAVIASDAPTAEKAEVAQLRNDLAASRAQLIIEQSENARKISALEEANRKDQVVARVERAIGREGKPPVMRDQIIEYGMMVTPDKLDEFIARIPSVDLTERGVATGSDLAELEPTQAEINVYRQIGVWDDKDPAKSRMEAIRDKAKKKGLTLPVEA